MRHRPRCSWCSVDTAVASVAIGFRDRLSMFDFVSCILGWKLAGAAAALVLAPTATADPECSSCEQGKDAIDDEVLRRLRAWIFP